MVWWLADEVAASASLDPGLTSALLSDALGRVPALTALQGFADSQPLPLGWAEVRPPCRGYLLSSWACIGWVVARCRL